jgi:hypothetical protein
MSDSIRAQLLVEFESKQRIEREKLDERARTLHAQQEKLDQTRRELNEQIRVQVEAERKRITVEEQHKAGESMRLVLEELKQQLVDEMRKREESQRAEMELRKQQDSVEQQKKEIELTVLRARDEEKLRVARAKDEEFRLREAEYRLREEQQKKQIEEIRLRYEQGSQQVQGEVLELDLQRQLIEAFARDGISEVAKGENGVDIHHVVRTDGVGECGLICWETKRVKLWKKDYVEKALADGRAAGAKAVVIVTTRVPHASFCGIERINDVWVCSPSLALALAAMLRQSIVGLAQMRRSYEGRETKMTQVYDYIASAHFRDRIARMVRTFSAMKADMEAERRAMEKLWKAREKQLINLMGGIGELRDEVEAIIGAEVPGLATSDLRALADLTGRE